MPDKKKYRVLDLGNTALKVVDFQGDDVVLQKVFAWSEIVEFKNIVQKNFTDASILSSVVAEKQREEIIKFVHPTLVFDYQTPLPIAIDNYQTVETLGTDRIANVVAADHYSSTKAALVIDIGTCIKFDLIIDGKYQGGSISPGYQMRLKAMHQFTGALPLLNLEENAELIGVSTKSSMLSGVMNGIQAEIEGFIERYRRIYGTLTIFFTGGDHKRFDIELKNSIFADENLTVKGLCLILKHNA